MLISSKNRKFWSLAKISAKKDKFWSLVKGVKKMIIQEFYKEFEKQARQMDLITLLSGFYLYLDTETDVLHDQMRDTSNEQEYKKYAKELVTLNAIKGAVNNTFNPALVLKISTRLLPKYLINSSVTILVLTVCPLKHPSAFPKLPIRDILFCIIVVNVFTKYFYFNLERSELFTLSLKQLTYQLLI